MKFRHTTKYIAAAVLLLAVLSVFLRIMQEGHAQKKSAFALNTYVSVTTYGADGAASDAAIEKIYETESRFSAYLDKSEIAYINSTAQKNVPIKVSGELFNIIKTALDYSQQSGGKFDITLKPVSDLWGFNSNPRVPSGDEITAALACTGYKNIVLDEKNETITFLKDGMQLDLGGIAKGFAADKTAQVLFEHSVGKALADLGGNILILGTNNSPADNLQNSWLGHNINRTWRVGIQTPFAPTGSYMAILELQNDAGRALNVVTSGAYERNFSQNGILYHHIIDPFTGYPCGGDIDSVTVIGASSMNADALSTSIFMMDTDNGISLAHSCGYDVFIIDKNKKIHTTLDKGCVEITDDAYSFAE